MSNSPYTIRNYQPSDFDSYVLLKVEAEKLEPGGHYVSPRVIAEHLGRPNYSPERDLFVVATARNIIGYMDVVPELDVGRVILHCFVHPDHRRRGLVQKLLGHAIHHAEELGVKVAHINIPQDNETAKNILTRLGFDFVRRFLELRLEIAEIRWQDIDNVALQLRHLQRGEEDKLAQIQNRFFAGTWGYNPNTVEEVTYWVNSSQCSPGDVVLACHEDKVIGYCWTRIICEAATGERKGQIFMLGTDPDYRGEGAGKKILLAGLEHLKSKSIQVAELTVDSENKAACALYRSVGFKVWTGSLWYEKIIN